MSNVLTILGASARAAAFSAMRAGLAPVVGDLFADVDLARRCPAVKVDSYPAGLAAVCSGPQPGGWMYCGALENHPSLIDRMGATRQLFGNAGAVVRRVRDPWLLGRVVQSCGLSVPEILPDGAGLPRDGTWLRKSLGSAGGIQVTPWTDACTAPAATPGWYFQRRIEGQPCSAVYVAARGRAVLLGLTEQLIGASWTGATGLRYCGSIGPLTLDAVLLASLTRLGEALAAEFDLQGLFGVDAIIANDALWPLEVNPRYTASVEVLEHALGIEAIRWHLDACARQELPAAVPAPVGRSFGKAVLYARAPLLVSQPMVELALAENADAARPTLADIPEAGSRIEAHWPILTVFADGSDRAEVLVGLKTLAARWTAALA